MKNTKDKSSTTRKILYSAAGSAVLTLTLTLQGCGPGLEQDTSTERINSFQYSSDTAQTSNEELHSGSQVARVISILMDDSGRKVTTYKTENGCVQVRESDPMKREVGNASCLQSNEKPISPDHKKALFAPAVPILVAEEALLLGAVAITAAATVGYINSVSTNEPDDIIDWPSSWPKVVEKVTKIPLCNCCHLESVQYDMVFTKSDCNTERVPVCLANGGWICPNFTGSIARTACIPPWYDAIRFNDGSIWSKLTVAVSPVTAAGTIVDFIENASSAAGQAVGEWIFPQPEVFPSR